PRTLGFLLGSALIIVIAPRYLPRVFERYGARVIEPEIKLLFFLLFVFLALGKWGQSHAVLPVFVLGLCLAKMFREHKELQRKLRIVAFAMITPFFFIKGGMNVSLPEVAEHWPLLLVLSRTARTSPGGSPCPGGREHLRNRILGTPCVGKSVYYAYSGKAVGCGSGPTNRRFGSIAPSRLRGEETMGTRSRSAIVGLV